MGEPHVCLDCVRHANRVAKLERVVHDLEEALRDSTKLLQRCRPARPAIPHERKLLTAQAQGWKCKNPTGGCPLHRLGDGYFDASLFECDHAIPYAVSFRSDKLNLCCLCPYCHALKSRDERLAQLEEEPE